MTAADVLIETLIDWGVDTIFGLPGDGINGLMESLRTHQDQIRFIQVRHEESAAFMACGYAKFTGRLAVREAIDAGRIPGPRLRISGNTVNILGSHEDAIGYNPEQHVLPNADYANNTDELVAVMRRQFKDGADFVKIYETGWDTVRDGKFHTIYQYTEAELEAPVHEAARQGRKVAVHATGKPGTLYAAQAGVASIDHAYQLSAETMRLMHE
jgi:imidazolonepropionase-like amidohydrolase